MNVGQVLETAPRLGRQAGLGRSGGEAKNGPTGSSACTEIGADQGEPDTNVATPVFDGAREDEITGLLGSTLPNRDGVQLIGEDGKADAVRRPLRRAVPGRRCRSATSTS